MAKRNRKKTKGKPRTRGERPEQKLPNVGLPPGVEVLGEQLTSDIVRAKQLQNLKAELRKIPDDKLLEKFKEVGSTREEIESAAIELLLATHRDQDRLLEDKGILRKQEQELAAEMSEIKKDNLIRTLRSPEARTRLHNELQGSVCRCGNKKISGRTFCNACWSIIKGPPRKGLYRAFGSGYEEAYAEAVRQLTVHRAEKAKGPQR